MITWSDVGAISAAVAAVAAVVAMYYAKETARLSERTLDTAQRAAAAEREVELSRRFIRVVESVSAIAEEMHRVKANYDVPLTSRLVTLRQAELKAALRALLIVGGPELPKTADLVDVPTDSVDYAALALAELDQAGRQLSGA